MTYGCAGFLLVLVLVLILALEGGIFGEGNDWAVVSAKKYQNGAWEMSINLSTVCSFFFLGKPYRHFVLLHFVNGEKNLAPSLGKRNVVCHKKGRMKYHKKKSHLQTKKKREMASHSSELSRPQTVLLSNITHRMQATPVSQHEYVFLLPYFPFPIILHRCCYPFIVSPTC